MGNLSEMRNLANFDFNFEKNNQREKKNQETLSRKARIKQDSFKFHLLFEEMWTLILRLGV